MSLINDLLRDLEDRRGGNKEPNELVDGLSQVHDSSRNHHGLPPYLIVILCVILLLLAFILMAPMVLSEQIPSSQKVTKSVEDPDKGIEVDNKPITTEESASVARIPLLKLDAGLDTSQVNISAVKKPASQKENVRISSLNIKVEDLDNTARLLMSDTSDYRLYTLENPDRVVIEIPQANTDELEINNEKNSLVRNVRQGMHDGVTRLVLDMERSVSVQSQTENAVDNQHVIAFTLVPDNEGDAQAKVAQSLEREDARTQDSRPTMNQTAAESYKDGANQAVHNRQMEKKPRNDSPATLAEKYYKKGVRQYNQGDLDNSIESLRRSIELSPENGRARYLLASAYIQQERTETAMSLLSQSVELLPHNHQIKKLYAQILFHLGRQQEAIKILRTQMPLIDESPEYHALLAGYLQNIEKHSQSADLYRSLVNIKPKQSVWWMGLGISLEALDKHSEALTAYKQAMQSGSLSIKLRRYVSRRIQSLSSEKST